MVKTRKKLITRSIALILLLCLITPALLPIQSKAETGITIKKYIELVVDSLKLKITDKVDADILDTMEKTPSEQVRIARALGIVKKGQFSDYNKAITMTQAAIITNRADEYKNGTDSYDKTLYDNIVSKKRISDISKIAKASREDVYKVFTKGIMVGKSNGNYTQNRKFNGSGKVTAKEADTIVKRLKTKTKRVKLSFDGQVIRTTKLPKNYKSYEYILESFPNLFYEKKFEYQRFLNLSSLKEMVNYAPPAKLKKKEFKTAFNSYDMVKIMESNIDRWVSCVEKNLKQRFNVDYRTVDNNSSKWRKDLRATYYVFNDVNADSQKTNQIKDYIKVMKKNKVVIKSSTISVEPSTFYDANGLYIRTYVKYKIEAANLNVSHEELIFGSYVYLDKIKKGQWMEGYFDIRIGSMNGLSVGSDFVVVDDALVIWPD